MPQLTDNIDSALNVKQHITPAPVISTTKAYQNEEQGDDHSEQSSHRTSTEDGMDNVPLSPMKSNNTLNENARSAFSDKPTAEKPIATVQRHISAAFDYNNRILFEGLFDFAFNRRAAWQAYRRQPVNNPTQKAVPLYVFGIIFRLLLLPLTSLVYNLSRISLIVLNFKAGYRHNPTKTVLMTTVTLTTAATLLTVGLLTPFFTQASLQLLSGVATGLTASVGSAIIVGALLSIGLSLLLHGAKKVAQGMNGQPQPINGDPEFAITVTAPKHHLLSSKAHEQVYMAHFNTLFNYYKQIKKPAISGVSAKARSTKSILNHFEMIEKASDDNTLTQTDYQALCDKAAETSPELGQLEVQQGKIVPKNNMM